MPFENVAADVPGRWHELAAEMAENSRRYIYFASKGVIAIGR